MVKNPFIRPKSLGGYRAGTLRFPWYNWWLVDGGPKRRVIFLRAVARNFLIYRLLYIPLWISFPDTLSPKHNFVHGTNINPLSIPLSILYIYTPVILSLAGIRTWTVCSNLAPKNSHLPSRKRRHAVTLEELPLGGIAYGSDCMVVCNDWHSALVPMLIHAEKTTTGCWTKINIYVTSGCVKPLVSVVTLPFLKVIYHDSMALPDHFHWICGGSHFETGCKESPLQGTHVNITWLQAKTGEQLLVQDHQNWQSSSSPSSGACWWKTSCILLGLSTFQIMM